MNFSETLNFVNIFRYSPVKRFMTVPNGLEIDFDRKILPTGEKE